MAVKDGFIIAHDTTANRTTLLKGDWSEYNLADVVGAPIIVRKLSDKGELTSEFYVTDQTVCSTLSFRLVSLYVYRSWISKLS